MNILWRTLLPFALAMAFGLPAAAQEHCANCGDCLHVKQVGTPPPGSPRVIPHTDARAGLPRCVSSRATLPNPGAIRGYYVGGGLAHGGEHPGAEQGTWGWDDTGRTHWRPRVSLRWGNGRRHQGGTGAYQTDGPHVPDIPTGVAARVRFPRKSE